MYRRFVFVFKHGVRGSIRLLLQVAMVNISAVSLCISRYKTALVSVLLGSKNSLMAFDVWICVVRLDGGGSIHKRRLLRSSPWFHQNERRCRIQSYRYAIQRQIHRLRSPSQRSLHHTSSYHPDGKLAQKPSSTHLPLGTCFRIRTTVSQAWHAVVPATRVVPARTTEAGGRRCRPGLSSTSTSRRRERAGAPGCRDGLDGTGPDRKVLQEIQSVTRRLTWCLTARLFLCHWGYIPRQRAVSGLLRGSAWLPGDGVGQANLRVSCMPRYGMVYSGGDAILGFSELIYPDKTRPFAGNLVFRAKGEACIIKEASSEKDHNPFTRML